MVHVQDPGPSEGLLNHRASIIESGGVYSHLVHSFPPFKPSIRPLQQERHLPGPVHGLLQRHAAELG